MKVKMNVIEKKTFRLFMSAMFFNGFIMSITNVQDIIAKKAFHGFDWQITILVMIFPISSLLSIWWGKIIEDSENKSKYFLIAGFLGRLSLVFGFFITNIYQFIFLLAFLLSFNSLVVPTQNTLLQANFRKEIRGKLFGYSASLSTLIALIGSYFAGRLLDIDEHYYKYIFVATGILGLIGTLFLAAIKVDSKEKLVPKNKKNKMRKIFLLPLIRSFQILKNDKQYRIYEIAFMIYGIGFMIVLPVIPRYLVNNLHMTYTQTFVAKGVISQLGILVFAPIAGFIHDKNHPNLFAAISFFAISFFPLILFFSTMFSNISTSIAIVYFSYIIYGIAMSGVLIAWNLGTIYFAKNNDVSMYQSVHVALTGVRGLIIPPLGFIILKTLGMQSVFIVSFLAFIIASMISFREFKKNSPK
jgi:MFS family permease